MARWTEPALVDLTEALDHIAQEDLEAARTVVARVGHAEARIDRFSGIGRAGRRQRTRELVLPGLPFILVYRVKFGEVEILRFIHTSRNWPS